MCTKCCWFYKVERGKPNAHVCYQKTCTICRTKYITEHLCYVQKAKKRHSYEKDLTEVQYVHYDFETIQCRASKNVNNAVTHEVRLWPGRRL